MKNKKIRGIKSINKDQITDTNQIFLGTFLILFGIILGIVINMNGTFSLEGRQSFATSSNATSSNATSSNATSSNATSSNATSSNATSSNATSSNATSSNAQKTDNIIYLNDIELETNNSKPSEKVYIKKSTSGACNTAISLTFLNEKDNSTFTVDIKDISSYPYFVIPENISSGNYKITNILLIGLNSDNTTFSRKYNKSELSNIVINNVLVIEKETSKYIELKNISLDNEGVIGEKVAVNVTTSEKLETLKLTFENSNKDKFSVYVQDLNDKPYFIVPNEVEEGKYQLYQAVLKTKDASAIYVNGENYNFSVSLDIKNNSKKTFVYNNENITSQIIKEIYNEEKDIDVIINANENPIISDELFNAIKGTKKNLIINYQDNQIVFCGNDIKNAKTINVSISTSTVSENEKIQKLVEDGIIVDFSSNGNLPGNALVKIKVTEDMKNKLGNNNVYIYYYDEYQNGFNIIAKEISVKNGYYEFVISHNSKYLLTKNKIADELVLEEEENVVHFQQSNSQYLLWLVAAISLVIVVILIMFVVNKKTKK